MLSLGGVGVHALVANSESRITICRLPNQEQQMERNSLRIAAASFVPSPFLPRLPLLPHRWMV